MKVNGVWEGKHKRKEKNKSRNGHDEGVWRPVDLDSMHPKEGYSDLMKRQSKKRRAETERENKECRRHNEEN